MYHRLSNGWLKHADFILLDVLSLQFAFVISYWLRNGIYNPYGNALYRELSIILILFAVCSSFLTENHKNILRRGYLKELKAVLEQTAYVAACEAVFLFLTRRAGEFSRTSFLLFIFLYPVVMYSVRCIWKRFLISHGSLLGEEKGILLIASASEAKKLAVQMKKRCMGPSKILGMGLLEYEDADSYKKSTDMKSYMKEYPVLASGEQEILDYVQNNWVDEAVISVAENEKPPQNLLERLEEMGVVTHQCLDISESRVMNQTVQKLWGYTVLTSYLHAATVRQIFMKRCLDICGGIVGMILTGLLTIVIGPLIYAASPGPIFFSQVRIGRGGKKFKIYKFRSMYMDAEQRKAELMKKNKMDGFMFKLDADPRIIGSGPDGTRKGIGWFIRKTSIDEFPQFWNVLKGDMSLVGTRPPTVDEWEQYEYHHRARMAAKPGITGLWQVSGRSEITDFEEVVALDMEYIRNWTVGEDIKILFRTVGAVVKGRGSI